MKDYISYIVRFVAVFSAAAALLCSCSFKFDFDKEQDDAVVNSAKCVSAGAYYMGSNSSSDIVDVYFATAGVDVSNGQFSGEGIGIWLDLNVSLDVSQFIPGGEYNCRKSEDSFTMYPGEYTNEGVAGTCIYIAENGHQAQIIPVIDGSVTFAVSGDLYVVEGTLLLTDRIAWTFSYSGYIMQIKDDEGDKQGGSEINLTSAYAAFIGNNIYDEQPHDINDWELYLLDDKEKNGVVIEFMTNTGISEGIPFGEYKCADINGYWFSPYTAIPAYEVEDESGEILGYGTWSVVDGNIFYGATSGNFNVAYSQKGYIFDYNFYDSYSSASFAGHYEGGVTIGDESAPAAMAKCSSACSGAPVVLRTARLMGKALTRMSARAAMRKRVTPHTRLDK